MRAHPTNYDLIISAGYDGICLVWDVSTLTCIRKIANTDDSSKNQSIFDAALSPDGQMCAFADDSGHLTINGIFVNEKAKKVPKQQFFSTDYNRCINDQNGSVFDTVTQLPPHLCDPPILERADNIPHPSEWQLMIPGTAARMRHPNPDQMQSGFFNAWQTEDIITPSTTMEEIIRTANFEGIHHSKEYQREASKTPPKGWNTEPISPTKKTIPRTPAASRQHVIELPISPDLPAANLDSDSDDNTYSGSSITADSLSDEERAVQDPLFDDDNDSDYFEGYDGPDTVFRNVQRPRRHELAAIAPTSTNNSGNEAGPSRPRRERRTSETANQSRSNSVSRRVNGRHTRANPVAAEEIPRARRGRPPLARTRRIVKSSDEDLDELGDNEVEDNERTRTSVTTPARNSRNITKFPEWMTKIKPKRFPYIAQLGDRV
uniref:WD40 repeat-like protein n=1 Tax=Panagrolaimus sp. ES5 TaxID=591445 RepID=A0AC34G965_9BILA